MILCSICTLIFVLGGKGGCRACHMHLCQLRGPRGGRLDDFYFCLSFRRAYFWARKSQEKLDTQIRASPVILLSRSLYRSHVLTTFLGPVLGAMMKQVCWHSRRSKAYRGLPEARGQSEAHGDSNLYTMGVRPCVTAKLPVLGPWFWNLILLNLAAASCYLHGGRFWRQQVPSPLWWRNLLQVLVRELNHFVATGISTVLLWLADAIRHCFLMLALLRPSRRTRQNRNRQQSAASGC